MTNQPDRVPTPRYWCSISYAHQPHDTCDGRPAFPTPVCDEYKFLARDPEVSRYLETEAIPYDIGVRLERELTALQVEPNRAAMKMTEEENDYLRSELAAAHEAQRTKEALITRQADAIADCCVRVDAAEEKLAAAEQALKEQREWNDSAVAACAKRGCSTIQRDMADAEEKLAAVERTNAMLADNWTNTERLLAAAEREVRFVISTAESLAAALRVAEQNAIRYEWLRAHVQWRTLGRYRTLQLPELPLPNGARDGLASDKIDAAIDAAIDALQPEKEGK